MATSRHTPAQIVVLLRRADELLAGGRRIAAVTGELGISEATFHRWRAQYGGIKAAQAQRLSELEAENRQLRALVANQTLDILVLRQLVHTLHPEQTNRLAVIDGLRADLNLSQRRACQLVGEPRTSVRRALAGTPEPTVIAGEQLVIVPPRQGELG